MTGAGQRGDRWIWLIAGTIAVAAALAVGLLVKLPPKQELPKARLGGGLGVQRLESDKLLAEQVELHDPIALFLPVGRSSQPAGPTSVAELEPDLVLTRPFTGKLAYAEDSATVDFPARVPIPARPVDAIGLGDPELPFLGMGRTDRVIPAPPGRAAYIEVVAADTGKTVDSVSGPILEAKVPNAIEWQPFEMLVIVDRMGLVTPPTISRTSKVDGIDDFFRDYLEKGLHLGEKLGPGSYVVTIGR
jgi:hypothetical protein